MRNLYNNMLKHLSSQWGKIDNKPISIVAFLVAVGIIFSTLSLYFVGKLVLVVLILLTIFCCNPGKEVLLSMIILLISYVSLSNAQYFQNVNHEFARNSFEVTHRPYLFPRADKTLIKLFDVFEPNKRELRPKLEFRHGLVNYGKSPAFITSIEILLDGDIEMLNRNKGVEFYVDCQSPMIIFDNSDYDKTLAIHSRKGYVNLKDLKRIFNFEFEEDDSGGQNTKKLIIKNGASLGIKTMQDVIRLSKFYAKINVKYRAVYHNDRDLFDDYETSYLVMFNRGEIKILDKVYHL